MPKLQIIVGSTRPGRLAGPIAQWAFERAEADGRFEVELVDIAEYELPVLDERHHPVLGRYEHGHTQRWAAKIREADAFIFVSPEYNYGPSAALLNAFDYLGREWMYAPVAFVSYGGIAGGLRAVQVMKQIVTTVRMMPLPDGVVLPLVMQNFEEGDFVPPPSAQGAVAPMLTELLRWTHALGPLRAEGPPPPTLPSGSPAPRP
ncbi:NADPH-dependent FMN reductase [Arthrobacter zhaoxinii]|uniref:NADPH-dependent FMN reductase n=1 Tax=Arthrobacter zhaoxinii TaxID=2964616 RepID=UPI00210535EE|nr:NADPH-dependent FMN reductase [Arthrobacter zhaoxinii]MCQ1999808.1 NAD(P)H-dependent oxidoreductase [Arthrobacter zhaoxinii]